MPIYSARQDLHYQGPVLTVDILVSTSLERSLLARGERIPTPMNCHALIDTGSTQTVIREGIAETLGLQPAGVVRAKSASAIESQCRTYAIQLVLPNGSTADLDQAVEMPLRDPEIDRPKRLLNRNDV